MKSSPREVAHALVAWYERTKKPLPWRDFPTPYRVWVGEVMSQQTSLAIASTRFESLVAELPDVDALAACSDDALRRLWAGLGYYARARNLAKGARYIAIDRGGAFPDSAAGWRCVPGCGPYTAAVIASVCFGEKIASVDGNAVRVASRLHAMETDVWTSRGAAAIADSLGAMISFARAPGDFNQAVMELGQEICSKSSPACDSCPVSNYCDALRLGKIDACPPSKPRPAPRDVSLWALIAVLPEERLVAVSRRERGFLAGTVGFPLWESPPPSFGGVTREVGAFRHTITRHRIACTVLSLSAHRGQLAALAELFAPCGAAAPDWISEDAVEAALHTSLDQKALALFASAPRERR